MDWSEGKLHFIAIGGAGMSGLALVCEQLGARVTGSDRAEGGSYLAGSARRPRAAGRPRPRRRARGRRGGRLDRDRDDNPELARARERGQRVLHRGELLAELCAARRLIAVAGTHGKTTTAGMLVDALRESAPTRASSRRRAARRRARRARPNAGWGAGEWVVAEADESDGSFLELRPEVAVVTNVELDHHSRWASRAELTEAFARFVGRPGGSCSPTPISTRSPGRRSGRFDGRAPARTELELAGPGPPQPAQRAGGASGARARRVRVRWPRPRRSRTSRGCSAARSSRAGRDGALIYDDYAHHPHRGPRDASGAARARPAALIAVFQPHLYSRTKALAEGFGAALAAADEVGVLDVYPAREEPVGELEGVSGLTVARATPPTGRAASRCSGCATQDRRGRPSPGACATVTCW